MCVRGGFMVKNPWSIYIYDLASVKLGW